MQIGPVSNASYQTTGVGESISKMKQLFQNLGNALESGNLSEAKEALAQLQQNAPARAGNGNNPISAKMEQLSKALDSGDLKAAQDAYADIKKTMSQHPPPGSGRAGGQPPDGAKQSSGAGGSSSSSQVYDKKDLNKDGIVSWDEEFAYSLNHPDESKKPSTPAKTDSDSGSIDLMA